MQQAYTVSIEDARAYDAALRNAYHLLLAANNMVSDPYDGSPLTETLAVLFTKMRDELVDARAQWTPQAPPRVVGQPPRPTAPCRPISPARVN